MNKPTHKEYLKALQTLKDYAPDKFLNIEEVTARNAFKDGHFLVHHEGYFLIASAITGEVIPCNTEMEIFDNVSDPLSAKGEFLLKFGVVTPSKFKSKTVVISTEDYEAMKRALVSKEGVFVDSKEYTYLISKKSEYESSINWNSRLHLAYREKMKHNWIQRLRNIDTLNGR